MPRSGSRSGDNTGSRGDRNRSVDNIVTITDVEQAINERFSIARKYLISVFKTQKSDSNAGGWSQFLDDRSVKPSVTGTAHGLTSLLATGEIKQSKYSNLGRQLIIKNARLDGGWSTHRFVETHSLTRITALTLKVLLDLGEGIRSQPISQGIVWLLQAQNVDGGWGNLSQDDQSDVTSTCYALRTLCDIVDISETTYRRAITKGRDWLLDARRNDSSWGEKKDSEGGLAYTAEAITTLIQIDPNLDLVIKSETLDYIIQNLEESEGISDFEEYYSVGDDADQLKWTQTPQELVLIALLKLNFDISNTITIDLAKGILRRQHLDGYWRSNTIANKAPVWATKQAVISLELYRVEIRNKGSISQLQKELTDLGYIVNEHKKRIERLEKIQQRKTIRGRVQRAIAFISKPLISLILVLLVLLFTYVFFKYYNGDYQNGFNIPDFILATIGIIGTIIAVYQFFKDNDEEIL